MKYLTTILALSCMFAAAPAARADENAENLDALLDAALPAIAKHEAGKSRAELARLDEMIRQTSGSPDAWKRIELRLLDGLNQKGTLEGKWYICRKLWRIGGDASVPVLAKMLVDETTAEMACYAILANRTPAASEAIRRALAGAQGKARLSIVALLGQRRDREAVPALAEMIDAGDEPLAVAAIGALGRIADPAAAAVLAKARASDAAEVRRAAQHALLRCAQRFTAEGHRAEAIAICRDLMRDNVPVMVRGPAMVEFAAAAGDAAAPEVVSALAGDDSAMRSLAIGVVCNAQGTPLGARLQRELHELPPAAAAEVLLAMSNAGPEAAKIVPTVLSLWGKCSQEPQRRRVEEALARLVASLGDRAGCEEPLFAAMLEADPPIRRVLLRVLGESGGEGALKRLSALLDRLDAKSWDADSKEAAASALLCLADRIASGHPDLARETVDRATRLSDTDTVRQQSRTVLASIDMRDDFITAWQLAGPYMKRYHNYAKLLDAPFPPEEADADKVPWKMIRADDPAQPWLIDLGKSLGGKSRAAYVRTWVYSPQAQSASLLLGSDDGVKAWLNGEQVFANNTARGCLPDQDRAVVKLREGWNALMLKVTQNDGPWACCARLRTAESAGEASKKIEGLRFDAAPH